MKKITAIFILAFLLLNSVKAQTVMNSVWMNGFGGTGNEHVSASAIDATGNIYIVGQIEYSLDIDPGAPTVTVSVNNQQCYFSKFSPTGSLIWSRNFDGESIAESNGVGITVSTSGDVYVTGSFKNGIVDFNLTAPGTNTIASADNDMFIVKYSSGGAFTWVKTIGTASANIRPQYIKVDVAGDVVIVGGFNNVVSTAVDFNPAGPSFTLASNNGPDDCFMAKYNSSGVLQWVFNIGSPLGEFFVGMDIDPANNIYVGGTFQSTIDVDPSSSNTVTIASNGIEDMFIGKYTSAGTFVWGHATGGTGGDAAYRLKVDNNGDLLVLGTFDSPTFVAGTGTQSVTLTKVGTGPMDFYLAKYNKTSGNLIWAKNSGGNAQMNAYAITSDAQSNIYIAGGFGGTADLDVTAVVNNFTASTNGGTDVFMAKYDPSGNFIVVYNFGGGTGSGHGANSMQIASNNDIILSGYYSAVFDFDPSAANNSLTYVAGADAFVNRYSQCVTPDTPTLSLSSVTICASNIATLTISGGNLNSATNWVWMTSCGSSQISTGLTFTASPPFQSTYFVRGEGGCTSPGACAGATISITPSKDLTGVVTTSSTVFVPGTVELYRKEGPLTKWDFVSFQNINASGIYTFNAVVAGAYIIMAAPTSLSLQTTYAPNATTWKGAIPFTLGCAANTNINIDVLGLTDFGGGPGVLTGKITEGLGYGNRGGMFSPGQPISGLSIKGGRNPGGNIAAQGKTNAAGEYTLSNLAMSAAGESYFIFVDIPGLDTNGTYHKAVITGSLQYGNLDFVVDSQYVNPSNFVGIKEVSIDNKLVSVYPNPAKNNINISIKSVIGSEIKIEVIDIFGKAVLEKNYGVVQGDFKTSLDVGEITKGIYFIKVKMNNDESRLKIILSE